MLFLIVFKGLKHNCIHIFCIVLPICVCIKYFYLYEDIINYYCIVFFWYNKSTFSCISLFLHFTCWQGLLCTQKPLTSCSWFISLIFLISYFADIPGLFLVYLHSLFQRKSQNHRVCFSRWSYTHWHRAETEMVSRVGFEEGDGNTSKNAANYET